MIFFLQLLTCCNLAWSFKAKYDEIVIFGDSTSDSGNVYKMTNSQIPPSPYYEGRYSNGLIWADQLKVASVKNYAYGGATTDNNLVQGVTGGSIRVPDVRQQIHNYSQTINQDSMNFNHTLYVIWAGANNFLRNSSVSVSSITGSIGDAAKDIINFGGKHVTLFNQPPLEIIPAVQPLSAFVNLTALGREYNNNLSAVASSLNRSYEVNVHIFNVNSIVLKILDNTTKYGITNTSSPCIMTNGTLCADPNSFMFFDSVHFTKTIHEIIADDFNKFITARSTKFTYSTILVIIPTIIHTLHFV